MKKQTKLCIAVIFILILLCTGLIFWQSTRKATGSVAEIILDGKCIKQIDLNTVDESYEFTVEGSDGAYNIVSVEHGRIAITEASCPDKICVHTGYISDSTKPITCLPNHLIIKITGKASDKLDAISN